MKGFVFYYDYLPLLDRLSDNAKGKLFRAVSEYSATGARCDLSGIQDDEKDNFRTLFDLIADQIEHDAKKRAEVSEGRRRAGLASVAARKARKGGGV